MPIQPINITEKLKRELEKTQNTDLLEMDSNPRLLSYICTLSFHRSLSSQRFVQSDSILRMMLVDISQVIRILN